MFFIVEEKEEEKEERGVGCSKIQRDEDLGRTCRLFLFFL